jgi:chromosomal replication initiator protein
MITIPDIQFAVASEFSVSMADMVERQRSARIARPRQVAMYLSRLLTGQKFVAIASHFGDRHHTTIIHAINRVGWFIEEDMTFASIVAGLEYRLRGMRDA